MQYLGSLWSQTGWVRSVLISFFSSKHNVSPNKIILLIIKKEWAFDNPHVTPYLLLVFIGSFNLFFMSFFLYWPFFFVLALTTALTKLWIAYKARQTATTQFIVIDMIEITVSKISKYVKIKPWYKLLFLSIKIFY